MKNKIFEVNTFDPEIDIKFKLCPFDLPLFPNVYQTSQNKI